MLNHSGRTNGVQPSLSCSKWKGLVLAGSFSCWTPKNCWETLKKIIYCWGSVKRLKVNISAEAKQGKGLTGVQVNSLWHAKLPAQTSFWSSVSLYVNICSLKVKEQVLKWVPDMFGQIWRVAEGSFRDGRWEQCPPLALPYKLWQTCSAGAHGCSWRSLPAERCWFQDCISWSCAIQVIKW